MLEELLHNISHNLFKPLLLCFYLGFSIPLFRVSFEFPYVLYQGLTMYLLLAIGWRGGEELAELNRGSLWQAVGFMLLGFCTNLIIGVAAYWWLRAFTKLRRIDAATVAGYYGSDSMGTFVTCTGVLAAAGIHSAAYMPVMLAVMQIPGCLVALYLVSRLRADGMDANGNAWDEAGYDPTSMQTEFAVAGRGYAKTVHRETRRMSAGGKSSLHVGGVAVAELPETGAYDETNTARENGGSEAAAAGRNRHSIFSLELLHEVFLNPGTYLLFGGIFVGFVSRLQGETVTEGGDKLFRDLFPGLLCLFLLEMGITASKRLKDLRSAGVPFIAFGLLAPNVFATFGIGIAHAYSYALGTPFDVGTYVLFAVLCGAASYIAAPAVQRLAIPEASPTLPLAASLGLTFTYNVTIGIPVYIMIAKTIMSALPVGIGAPVG